jgi:hypothetical protein
MFGVVVDTRTTCSLIDTNCFEFDPIFLTDLKQCKESMLTLFRQRNTNKQSTSNNLYDQLIRKLHLQIKRQIRKEPDHSFRFKNDMYKSYLTCMVELCWLQYYFLRVFTDGSYVTHGKSGYADVEGFELVDTLRHSFKLKVDVLADLNRSVAVHEAQVRQDWKMKASHGDLDAVALLTRNKLLTKERVRRVREKNKI